MALVLQSSVTTDGKPLWTRQRFFISETMFPRVLQGGDPSPEPSNPVNEGHQDPSTMRRLSGNRKYSQNHLARADPVQTVYLNG